MCEVKMLDVEALKALHEGVTKRQAVSEVLRRMQAEIVASEMAADASAVTAERIDAFSVRFCDLNLYLGELFAALHDQEAPQAIEDARVYQAHADADLQRTCDCEACERYRANH